MLRFGPSLVRTDLEMGSSGEKGQDWFRLVIRRDEVYRWIVSVDGGPTDGRWRRPVGETFLGAVEVVEVLQESKDGVKVICAPKHVATRGDTLNCKNSTLTPTRFVTDASRVDHRLDQLTNRRRPQDQSRASHCGFLGPNEPYTDERVVNTSDQTLNSFPMRNHPHQRRKSPDQAKIPSDMLPVTSRSISTRLNTLTASHSEIMTSTSALSNPKVTQSSTSLIT